MIQPYRRMRMCYFDTTESGTTQQRRPGCQMQRQTESVWTRAVLEIILMQLELEWQGDVVS